MYCNGACAFCSVPCRKEVPVLGTEDKVENVGTFEIKKNLFGKEKVRKVANENRAIGIEYTSQR